MKSKFTLSVVIPAFNEQEVIENSLRILDQYIKTELKDLISDFEFIVVNNGSSDDTLKILLDLKKVEFNSSLKIIDLTKNFGCQASVSCGIENINHDLCLIIDSDLQVEVDKIREMILKIGEETDLVLGIMSSRDEDSFFKKISSDFFYFFVDLMGINSFKNHSYFRVFKKSVALDLKKFKEIHRIDRLLFLELTNRIKTVNYKRVKRNHGISKMNFKYLVNLAVNAITSNSIMPIRFFLIIGALESLISIVFIFSRIIKNDMDLLNPIIFFNTGLILISIGIIGEYIFRAFIESKSRPLYLVRNFYK